MAPSAPSFFQSAYSKRTHTTPYLSSSSSTTHLLISRSGPYSSLLSTTSLVIIILITVFILCASILLAVVCVRRRRAATERLRNSSYVSEQEPASDKESHSTYAGGWAPQGVPGSIIGSASSLMGSSSTDLPPTSEISFSSSMLPVDRDGQLHLYYDGPPDDSHSDLRTILPQIPEAAREPSSRIRLTRSMIQEITEAVFERMATVDRNHQHRLTGNLSQRPPSYESERPSSLSAVYSSEITQESRERS